MYTTMRAFDGTYLLYLLVCKMCTNFLNTIGGPIRNRSAKHSHTFTQSFVSQLTFYEIYSYRYQSQPYQFELVVLLIYPLPGWGKIRWYTLSGVWQMRGKMAPSRICQSNLDMDRVVRNLAQFPNINWTNRDLVNSEIYLFFLLNHAMHQIGSQRWELGGYH